MSRSSAISTARGTKRETLARISALRAQFGEHGVEVVEHAQERRGAWRLRFKLTPEREARRLQNLALKGQARPVFEPSASQAAILGALLSGFELLVFSWAGKPAYRLSSKHTREKGEDIAVLCLHRLIRRTGDTYTLTPAGTREVLRRLGGNS